MRDAQDVDVLDSPVKRSGRVPSPLRVSIPIALVVIAADQATKRWALSALEPGSCSQPDACIDLFAGIRLHLVFNTGAAFTRGSGYGPLLGVLAFGMAGLLLYLSSRRDDLFGVVLFGAIAGGAIGNLIDRIYRAEDGLLSGAVVDFIDVGWWPVFNIADSAIVVGVIGVIVHSFLATPAEPEGQTASPDETDRHGPADDAGTSLEPNESSSDRFG